MSLPYDAATTSEVLFFFDDLFDSFNKKMIQNLLSNTESENFHFWQEACRKLIKMEFVEKQTHNLIRRNKPKCLHNWIYGRFKERSIYGTNFTQQDFQIYDI